MLSSSTKKEITNFSHCKKTAGYFNILEAYYDDLLKNVTESQLGKVWFMKNGALVDIAHETLSYLLIAKYSVTTFL